jgi:hypothetical protein
MKVARQLAEWRASAVDNHAARLDAAFQSWCKARNRFKVQSSKAHLDAYDAATNELGLSISRWQAEQPELVDQVW